MITTEQRIDLQAIAKEVLWASPLVAAVDVCRVDDGWEAHLTFDSAMIRARAGQQGLRDRSVGAAAGDPRVQKALANAISRANARLGDGQQIVRHLVVIS